MKDNSQRPEMMEELYRRYGGTAGLKPISNRLRFWKKKYAWLLIIGGANFLKRTFDILLSLLLLLIFAPVLMCVALAIKLEDGGPVLFWQTRVGKWGREFSFPKFRSMVPNAEHLKKQLLNQSHHSDSITFKIRKDPRVTRTGRIIRKGSIDELPQLLNVLKGEMSIVGPRPPLPSEVAQYSLSNRRRLDVKPGLTCIWQVSGRGNIPFSEQVKLDEAYIESRSFWTDIKILIRTIPAVLSGKGAY